jgi:uncharacterized membrane protein (UPF0127 family)
MSRGRLFAPAALLIVFPLAYPTGVPGSDSRPDLGALPHERIVLETRASGRHDYRAWRADTPDTRASGLMYVSKLAEDQAMIFVYEEPQVVSMWMKNTYLPLDMLFVDARGCIVSIAEQTRPLSLKSIQSGSPVVLVVEIRGGGAAARSAKVGDRVLRPDARWPEPSAGRC